MSQQNTEVETAHVTQDSPRSIYHLSGLLGKKYQKTKWYRLLPAAITELRNEGYHEELGMPPSKTVFNGPFTIRSGNMNRSSKHTTTV